MQTRELRFETAVPVPREVLFAFLDRSSNLTILMEGFPGLRIEEAGTRDGEEARVHVRLGPLWISMAFLSCVREPACLGERMVRGPFAELLHLHELQQDGVGATRMIDRLTYRVPRFLGGGFSSRLLVEPAIRRMFRFRSRRFLELARTGALEEAP